MPQDGLFFRVLRRFNTIMATILGLSLIAFVGWHLYKTPNFRRELLGQPIEFKNDVPLSLSGPAIEPDSYGSANTHYGPHENTVLVLNRRLPFTPMAVPASFDSFSAEPQQAINIMVLDDKTGAGHWLFADNKQTITMRDALYQGAPAALTTANSDTRPVLGMVMVVVRDAAKPGAEKPQAIYVWTKQLGNAKKLLDIDEMISLNQLTEDRYVVIFRKGKAIQSATYSVPDFKLLSEVDLPAAPK